MSSQRVTFANMTALQIKQLCDLTSFCQEDTLESVCNLALAGDGMAIKAIVDEINNRAKTAGQRRRRAATTAVADLIIELQLATSEYQARVAEISARIVDAVKGDEGMKTKNAAQLVMQALSRLQELFIDEAELTFIMRVPDEADAYMLITNDDLAELIALLQRCENNDSRRTSPTP